MKGATGEWLRVNHGTVESNMLRISNLSNVTVFVAVALMAMPVEKLGATAGRCHRRGARRIPGRGRSPGDGSVPQAHLKTRSVVVAHDSCAEFLTGHNGGDGGLFASD